MRTLKIPLRAATLAFVLALSLRSPAAAVGTDPTLSLTSVQAFNSSGGVTSLAVSGTFSFDDLVQFSYPLGVIVYKGSSFVRCDLGGQPYEGVDAVVANGVADTDIAHLLTVGTASGAPARLLEVRPDRIALALPSGLGSGTASVIVYAILEGNAFVSNTLTVTLP